MKRRLVLFSVALMLCAPVFAPACAKAPPTLSPAGSAAFQATRIVKALDVLQDFAIAGEAQTPKLISTAHTRLVVNFVAASVRTIQASPGGWKPTVLTGLDQLQRDLLPDEWNAALPYISLLKTLVEGVKL